jgi:hypothetical protein
MGWGAHGNPVFRNLHGVSRTTQVVYPHVPALMSLQGQNLALAMAAPCARASSFPQITSESMPLEPTWMLNPQSTAAMTLSRPTRLA